MTSQIDPTVPVYGTPQTATVRANFQTAHDEITALQTQTAGAPFLSLTGGLSLPTSKTGLQPGTLWNNGGVICVA